ncbi:MAG: CARDB domain-containing protein [Candidatus Limnocylindrales bacterium]
MPVARHLMVVLFAAIWIVSACVSVAPSAETSPPVALPTGSGVDVTLEPPVELPSEPPVIEPTQAPEPEPTATTPATEPEPTERPEPVSKPNLVISEFVTEADPVLVGSTVTLTATIANIGPADAGPFIAEIVATTAGEPELVLESKAFENGLTAGDSTQLTTSINPNEAGGFNLLARVDPFDQINEKNESDNERVLEIVVQAVGNLSFTADGLEIYPIGPDYPKLYLFDISIVNSGPSTLVGPMSVKYFAYTDAGDYVEWGTVEIPLNLAPDDPGLRQVRFDVEPGTYRAYALLDTDGFFEETDEDDNEAYYDFTAP